MVPFDNQTSASLRLGYSGPAIPSARLSFRYTSMYPPPAKEGNEWAGRVFMSVTACGKEVLRADMFALGASSGGDLGASGESSFVSISRGGASVLHLRRQPRCQLGCPVSPPYYVYSRACLCACLTRR